MLEHVRLLAKQHEVTTVFRPGSSFGSHTYKTIWTPKPNGYTTYFTALHELGHAILDPHEAALLDEAQAWHWALDHALFPLTPGARNSIKRFFTSYVDRAWKIEGGARTRAGKNINARAEKLNVIDVNHELVKTLYDRLR